MSLVLRSCLLYLICLFHYMLHHVGNACSFFRTRLKVLYSVFLEKIYDGFLFDFSLILFRFAQVKFVSHYDNWTGFLVRLMVSNFVNPLIYFVISLSLGQVKNNDHCISILKVACRYCIKPLLSRSIPYLKITVFVVRGLKPVRYLRYSKGRNLVLIEFIIDKSIYQWSFSNCTIPK